MPGKEGYLDRAGVNAHAAGHDRMTGLSRSGYRTPWLDQYFYGLLDKLGVFAAS